MDTNMCETDDILIAMIDSIYDNQRQLLSRDLYLKNMLQNVVLPITNEINPIDFHYIPVLEYSEFLKSIYLSKLLNTRFNSTFITSPDLKWCFYGYYFNDKKKERQVGYTHTFFRFKVYTRFDTRISDMNNRVNCKIYVEGTEKFYIIKKILDNVSYRVPNFEICLPYGTLTITDVNEQIKDNPFFTFRYKSIENPIEIDPIKKRIRSLLFQKSDTRQQLKFISKYGENIMLIPNPSEQIQLAALETLLRNEYFAHRFLGYLHLKDIIPTDSVAIKAIQLDPYNITFIKYPSEHIQETSVQQNGLVIQYIKYPSERVQELAVQQNPKAIQHIRNPPEKIQLAAIRGNPDVIKYIQNPTKHAIYLATHLKPDLFSYIVKTYDIPEHMQRTAVSYDPSLFKTSYKREGKLPPESVRIAAVGADSSNFDFLRSIHAVPSLAVIQAAERARERKTIHRITPRYRTSEYSPILITDRK